MAKLNEDGNATNLLSAIIMLMTGAVTIFIIVPATTDILTSQVGGMLGDTAAFEAMVTMAKFTVLAVVVITTITFLRVFSRESLSDYEETPPHSPPIPPQTVVSNIPHATIYVAGGGGAGGNGGGHTPQHSPSPNTSSVEYELPKPKKPIVDRDGVEDDDSSFIEVLD
jgi:hypothetical protein